MGFGISPGMDDAYIVEYSVKGILSGKEIGYLNSSPWDGVTSPIYVFISIIQIIFLHCIWIQNLLYLPIIFFSYLMMVFLFH